MSEDFLWEIKYRPQTIKDTILPKSLKNIFQGIVDSGELPNMLFAGSPGLGKTTVAKALCEEMDIDYIFINASEDGNIDTLRNKIRQFASTVSLHGGLKCVILDEADYLNAQSFQPALRGFITEFSKNCRFILTANYKNKILAPLHSRLTVYDFNTNKKELQTLAVQYMSRIEDILESEKVDYDKQAIANMIMKFAPDWRRVLNEMQRLKIGEARISTDAVTSISSEQFEVLYKHIKDKNFKEMRKWVANNVDTDGASIFRGIFDTMDTRIEPTSIPQVVLILAEYQYKAAFVPDHELNLMACMTEIMSNVTIK